MQLIGTLASGVAGAENGYARILVRGSSKRARYFSDFEGDNAIDGSDVQLDVNGGAVIYVNITVDVLVYGENDQLVRRWIESSTAACVELISPSFTGADYETGVGGPNKPTTVAAAFDRLLVSFGAEDFLVKMPDGSEVTLQDAFETVHQAFFNVMDSSFGATGNGSTPDGPAIQAAINAAAVSGGTVFFPAGTYSVDAGISVPNNVSLLGANANAAKIVGTMAGLGPVLLAGGGGQGMQSISSLSVSLPGASSRTLVDVSATARVSLSLCFLSGALGVVVRAGKTYVIVDSCDVVVTGPGNAIFSELQPRVGRIDVRRSRFTTTPASGMVTVLSGVGMHLLGCLYDGSPSTTAVTFLSPVAVAGLVAYGSARSCELIDSAGFSITAFALGTVDAATEWFTEDGTFLAMNNAGSRLYSGTFGTTPVYYCRLGSREQRIKTMATAVAAIVITDTLEFGVVNIRSTFAGNITINPDPAPIGTRLRVIFVNGDAAQRTLTFGSNARGGSYGIAPNNAIGFELVRAVVNNGVSTVASWYVVGTSGVLTTGTASSYPV